MAGSSSSQLLLEQTLVVRSSTGVFALRPSMGRGGAAAQQVQRALIGFFGTLLQHIPPNDQIFCSRPSSLILILLLLLTSALIENSVHWQQKESDLALLISFPPSSVIFSSSL